MPTKTGKKFLTKPYVIGLTGGIGSGKSLAGERFQKMGVAVFDADQIVRDLIAKQRDIQEKVIDKFGREILNTEGHIDRKKLQIIIFESGKKRKWLEKLLHPLVIQEFKKMVANVKSPYCVLIIPLLFEAKLENFVDRILVLDTTVKLQIERTRKRSRLTYRQIRSILKTQISRKKRRQKADDLIKNLGTKTAFVKAIKEIHKFYLTLSKFS